jgi:CheY-like chemotaxis protein
MNTPVPSPKSVLLADGYAPALVVAEELLKLAGYRVIAATTQAEALKALESERFDVLVSSGKLQRLDDGYRLLELAAERFPDMRLVLHSGSRQPAGLKVHGYALKVHGDKDLVGVVGKVLSA